MFRRMEKPDKWMVLAGESCQVFPGTSRRAGDSFKGPGELQGSQQGHIRGEGLGLRDWEDTGAGQSLTRKMPALPAAADTR